MDSAAMLDRREQRLQQEIALEKRRLGLASTEKPKRDRITRLSDDGELLADEDSKVKRDTISAE